MTQSKERLRRADPDRTQPYRSMMHAFGKGEAGGPPGGHPLGIGGAVSAGQSYADRAVQEASDLVDRHIRTGAAKTEQIDNSFQGMSWLSTLAQSQDLAGLMTQATKAYSEITTMWVELAATIRDHLANTRAPAQTDGAQNAAPAGETPVLRLRASCMVEARVDMLRPGTPERATQLAPEEADQTGSNLAARLEDGHLVVTVPAGQTPGRYNGLLLDGSGGPVGVIMAEVFADDGSAA
ncbi:MAG: hypothetical protein AAF393_05560 [Pseudomonadota bacterium]